MSDHYACRAMSFPVVSSLSAEELVGLGQMHEKHSTCQTGTLITGNDVVCEDNNPLTSWVEKLLVRRRGKNMYNTAHNSLFHTCICFWTWLTCRCIRAY